MGDKAEDVLKGTTLEVYRFMLKNGKPLGIREVQRALELSSPSLAVYHINKLEDVGLLKKENGNYVVNRVVLEDTIKISRFLIPRFTFYAIFTTLLLIIETTLLRPTIITSFVFFAILGTIVCAAAFWYETTRIWHRGSY